MRKPLIGITVDYVTGKPHYMLPWTYAQAVERAGGLPLMIPYRTDLSLIPQYVETFDGLLLAGGDDLHPSLYGDDEPHLMAKAIDPLRQAFELALLAEVERRAMPVLGVCLGSQVMNVHRGGSLHQFLPDVDRADPIEHRLTDDWASRHAVHIDPQSKLASVIGGTDVTTNTSHKQAVRRPGNALRVVAHAPDGVIEAIEDPSFPFFIGVQWHPERIAEQPEQLRLFQSLVQHAGRHAKP